MEVRTHQGSEGNQERALQTKGQRSSRTQALGQGEGAQGNVLRQGNREGRAMVSAMSTPTYSWRD